MNNKRFSATRAAGIQRIKRISLGLLAASISLLANAAEQDDTPITPYRPSVSNSAQLPFSGQLEAEFGMLSGKSGDARRDSLPSLLKLAFSEQWGILLGGDLRVMNDDGAGTRVRGMGDVNLVLKRAFLIDSDTAFGLELGVKLPTAKQAIGTEKRDYTLNGIYSKDLGDWHLDLNANVTKMGWVDDGVSRWQTGLSSAFSYSLSEALGVTAEWSGTKSKGSLPQNQVLLALTYSPNKRLTFDTGLSKGISATATDRAFFAGVVVPVGRLF